jgi:hypothetical protein
VKRPAQGLAAAFFVAAFLTVFVFFVAILFQKPQKSFDTDFH